MKKSPVPGMLFAGADPALLPYLVNLNSASETNTVNISQVESDLSLLTIRVSVAENNIAADHAAIVILQNNQAIDEAAIGDLTSRVVVLENGAIVFDGRLDALEAADVVIDGRLESLEAADVVIDGRLEAIEGVDFVLDGRVDNLEACCATVKSRLDADEESLRILGDKVTILRYDVDVLFARPIGGGGGGVANGIVFPSVSMSSGMAHFMIGSLWLVAGTYSTLKAALGCGNPSHAATLALAKEDGTVIATVGGTAGGVTWRTASSGFTVSADMNVDLLLYGNAAGSVNFMKGLMLE